MANLRVDKITSTETFEKTGSVQFDGVNDGLTVTDVAAFDLGTGDFTIEGWYYLANAGTYVSLFDFRGSGADGVYPSLLRNNTGDYIYYYVDSAQRISNVSINYNTWFHVAVCRSSGITRLFLNGKEKGSFQDSFDYVSRDILLGVSSSNSNDLTGNISNYRIVKGRALYTSNFKTPMRELEVVPGTVLLACQSKTDASLEKTGKTITVNGNAVANELTPGLLTPIPKAGGGSAITGSVEFDGTGNYLSIPDNTDFTFGTGDFTIEFWRYRSRIGSTESYVTKYNNTNATQSFWFGTLSSGREDFAWYSGSNGYSIVSANNTAQVGEWGHLAAVRYNGDITLYLNGVAIVSDTSSDAAASFNDDSNPLIIGGDNYSGSTYDYQGFISNLRIVKGTALYTGDFIPPTRELKRVPGTVLLCCQDSNDPTQEVTGKTISLNGIYTYDTVVTSGITTAPTPSNFTPQVGDDRKVTFEGVTKINSNAYFYLPTGDTITRDSRSGRGLFGGGKDPSGRTNCIDYINISSEGNGLDFGDLILARDQLASCSSSTRGLWAGGDPGTNVINFVTIATRSNAVDFGDLVVAEQSFGGAANHTRGLFFGGSVKTIQYVTIASTGDAIDFGDLVRNEHDQKGCGSPTRGIIIIKDSSIEFVTFASTGNATDFGDTTGDNSGTAACSDSTRAIRGGGTGPQNAIEYITIASTGDAKDFGDLTLARNALHAVSNSVRGVFGGGDTPSPFTNTIDYVTIQSTGNAQDFGDLSVPRENGAGCSDSHGGLG